MEKHGPNDGLIFGIYQIGGKSLIHGDLSIDTPTFFDAWKILEPVQTCFFGGEKLQFQGMNCIGADILHPSVFS